ncbi:hypothetical protein V6N13_068429 [Hibiscus sabdariffa]
MLSNYVLQRAGSDLGNEVFHDQAVLHPHMHIPPEEHGATMFPCVGGNLYQALHVHAHSLWRNVQNQTHGAPVYEACGLPRQVNSTFLKDPAEASARHHVATDGQNPWVESPQKVMSSDGTAVPDIDHANVLHCQETQDAVATERVQVPQDKFATSTEHVQLPDQPLTLIHDTSVSSRNQKSQDDSSFIGAVGIEDKIVPMEDSKSCED